MSNNIRNRQSAEILKAVYRNSQMAYEASSDVLKHCKNNMLFREINREKERYKNVAAQSKSELARRNEPAEEVAPFGKMMSKMGIAMKTASDQSSGNIAKIMLRGTTMGRKPLAQRRPENPRKRGKAPRARTGILRKSEKIPMRSRALSENIPCDIKAGKGKSLHSPVSCEDNSPKF